MSDIAIIGMAGRFPKAKNVTEFWNNLRDGVEAVTYFSDEELRAAGVDEGLIRDPNYVRGCNYLEGADLFDAGFFEVNPREAELTDPQQRVFLECAWEALEDAGYDPQRYPGSIAVFAGSGRNQYILNHVLANAEVFESMGVVAAALVNEKDFMATRVSYKLDLRGPSVSVQTACSTSLVALHLGSMSLLAGECDMVMAGGCCVAALKKEGYLYIDGGVFAKDGHVYAFDHRGSGQVGGNGAAIVVLKRLEDALADGDSIRAVIKGSALNNDGIRKVSFSAPGVDGQAAVIVEALEVSGVHPESVTYVETHGTGTQLGDPIEVAALTKAYRTRTQKTGYCPIGSLKTNVGHLDAGAGAAAIIKTALSLQHKQIPPSLNYEKANPEIDFESSPFFVNTELRDWDTDALPRRAGVSSFGMGGTNAHVILEEAPEPEPTTPPARRHQILCLSARNKTALEEATVRLADHLEAGEIDLADAAYTTQVGRRGFDLRRAVVCTDRADAVEALRALKVTRAVTQKRSKAGRTLCFLFTGQGSQYPNMARGLYESEATFRAEVDRCCELLRAPLGRDLRELLLPRPEEVEAAAEELKQTRNTQPALFVIEYALAKLYAEWGIEPAAMVGHSIGEYVAACLAGVFSLEDALRIVAARGRLIGSLPAGGAMLAVQLPEQELTPRLGSLLSFGAINAPGLCVVSGPIEAIDALAAELDAEDVGTRKLRTSHAFHSSLMDPILAAFGKELEAVTLNAPQERFVSCSSGTWISPEEATDPAYWVRHVRQPVRFAAAVATAAAEKEALLLEVGPGQTLASLARMCCAEGPQIPILQSTRHPGEERDDAAFLMRTLGELWALGVEVDWAAFHAGERRRRIPLPTYPFQRQRYWIEASQGGPRAASASKKNSDLGAWSYAPSWKRGTMPAPSPGAGGVWLIFADRGGLASELAERLVAEGAPAFKVSAGDGFERVGERGYRIDPRNPADYTDLLEDLRERGGAPSRIVHAWGVDAVDHSLEALDAAQDLGFYSLLYLAQAVSGAGELEIDIVTAGMQEVLGGELLHPEKATLLGCCKAINAELAGVRCRAIDIEIQDTNAALDGLLSELRSGASEPVVAHRGIHRWVPDVERFHLGEVEGHPGLREKGVYLITGGLGGIGLALAEHLARAVQARLVLVGRSSVPAPEAWDAWLGEHGEDDAVSRKVRSMQRLQELGAEVLCLSADVADLESMRAVVEQAKGRFGCVNGVIHAAGIPGAGLIELKSRGAARKVLAPKVRGTQVLQAALKTEELDFLCLCSSLATAIEGVGQVDYFAANAYLDAFALHMRGRSPTRTFALSWDAWKEVGMAVQTVVPESLRKDREANLKTGISPDEGREFFRRALASSLSHVFVSTRDLPQRIAIIAGEVAKTATQPVKSASSDVEAAAPTSGAHARPELITEYAAPEGEIEKTIAEIWADLLGIDRVGRNDDVFELGGNSLLLMQLSVRLRTLYGVKLPMRTLFETPTVVSLAERVESVGMVMGAPSSEGSGDSDEETEEVSL